MERRYTESEMRLILKRALEPGARPEESDHRDPGLSLAQIKGIGAEVGIDPHEIEMAASDLPSASDRRGHPYSGIPTTLQFQSVVEGLEPDLVPRHEILSEIRSVLGRHGIDGGQAGAFEWKARDATGGRYVSLTPTKGGMRLSVMGNYGDGLGMSLGVVGGVIFTGAAAVISATGAGPAGILLGAAAVAFLPPRFVYRWWRKREDAGMAILHRRLLELLGRSSNPTSEPRPPLPAAPSDAAETDYS